MTALVGSACLAHFPTHLLRGAVTEQPAHGALGKAVSTVCSLLLAHLRLNNLFRVGAEKHAGQKPRRAVVAELHHAGMACRQDRHGVVAGCHRLCAAGNGRQDVLVESPGQRRIRRQQLLQAAQAGRERWEGKRDEVVGWGDAVSLVRQQTRPKERQDEKSDANPKATNQLM